MMVNIEDIKTKTTCPDCGGKELSLGYSYGEGSLHKKTSILGMAAYSQGSNIVHIICRNCGLLIKSFATDTSKL